MIAAVLPPQVVTVVATPEMWEGGLYPEEEALVARAVPKRRREFTAGRRCARQALRLLGCPDAPLLSGPGRQVEWPDGVTGSITHTQDYCAAAAALRRDFRGVGVDVEPVETLQAGVRRHICTPRELATLEELERRVPLGDASKLYFCAKESVYKCYFPVFARFLGFHDVEIDVDPEACTFRARPLTEFPGREVLAGFHGRFHAAQGLLAAGIVWPA